MIVVIQCAARKYENAGCLTTRDGKPVIFVGDPDAAPPREDCLYARPDDQSDQAGSWRDVLVRYNENPSSNPLGLLPASGLYANGTYRALVEKFGKDRTYVLSAGWGLIAASFLTPYYDITFSMSAEDWKRRRKRDTYADLCHLSADANENVIFIGGKDYLPLFVQLTASARARRTVFYNSATLPEAPGCYLVRFATATRTKLALRMCRLASAR